MSRIFTLPVLFQNRTYTALVDFRSGYDLSVRVRYLDEEVEEFLPGRFVSFSLSSGLESPEILGNQRSVALVQSTSDAISDFLQSGA